jgi:hypothetical protein
MLGLSRLLIGYLVAVPLALVLGLLLATPDLVNLFLIGSVLFFLSLPFLIKWHHLVLIIFWNSAFNIFFLPGQPHFWLAFAAMSFGFSWLNGILGKRRFLRAPEITKPLLLLAGVVLVTLLYRRSFGIRTLGGSSYGGRNYVYVAAAILGYFALTAEQIPLRLAARVSSVYFLSSITFAFSNLAYALGPAFYFLFYLFPTEYVVAQAGSQMSAEPGAARISGLTPAAIGLIYFLLMRWGAKGIFSVTRPWRMALFLAAVAVGSYGGFRGMLVITVLVFGFLFLFEGLWRTRYLFLVGGAMAAILVLLTFTSQRLPLQLQRAASVMPWLKVDPTMKIDAESSTQWRVDMWKSMWPELPNYILIGKGYAIDPTDLFLAQDAVYRGLDASYEASKVAGDYHSGPLSVFVPFGLGGAIAFIWLMVAGTKVLYLNYKNGRPELQNINTFLFALFVAQLIFFLFVVGALNTGLPGFTGVLGLSISLNGGVARGLAPARQRAFAPFTAPQPA